MFNTRLFFCFLVFLLCFCAVEFDVFYWPSWTTALFAKEQLFKAQILLKKLNVQPWQNDGVMDDKSGDDDTGEVRWSWRRGESGRGRSRRGWRSEWGSWDWCSKKADRLYLHSNQVNGTKRLKTSQRSGCPPQITANQSQISSDNRNCLL